MFSVITFEHRKPIMILFWRNRKECAFSMTTLILLLLLYPKTTTFSCWWEIFLFFIFNQKTQTLALSVTLSLKRNEVSFSYITSFLFHKHISECIWQARCAEEFLSRNLVHTIVPLSTLHIGVPFKELEKLHMTVIEDLSARHLTQPLQFIDRET